MREITNNVFRNASQGSVRSCFVVALIAKQWDLNLREEHFSGLVSFLTQKLTLHTMNLFKCI